MQAKSILTNLICAALAIAGYFSGIQALLMAGLFGLSGALTNHLAVHMLFERVPLLYGSGVIQLRFEAFKSAVKNLIMNEFFSKEQLENFFQQESARIELAPLIEQSDVSPAFEALKASVMKSSFGPMLGMLGGEKALEGLKEPFEKELRAALVGMVEEDMFRQRLDAYLHEAYVGEDIHVMLEEMIQARLDSLTPDMVKDMVATLIREHLGWLVVWGGFFGGLIGLVGAILL
jgi:uncharacterized membrane protein YheB (UPF0754 family)